MPDVRELGDSAVELDRAMKLLKEKERIRRKLGDKEGLQRSAGNQTFMYRNRGESNLVRNDTEALSRDLELSRADLESFKRQFQEEIERRTALGIRYGELALEKEKTEKTLSADTLELEQLRSALATEKDRAATAGQELESVLEEKSRIEQELRQMIEEITEKAKIQEQENLRLTDDLTAEHSRRTEIEHLMGVLREETAKKETAFAAEKEILQEERNLLQQKFFRLTKSFDTEHRKFTALLEEAHDAVELERSLRLSAEKTLKETVSARDEALQVFRSARDKFQEELEAKEAELAIAARERDAAKTTRESIEKELETTKSELSDALQERDVAKSTLESIEKDLETKKSELLDALRERDVAKSTLESIEKDLETKKSELAIAMQERDAATALRENLEEKLAAAVKGQEESEELAESISSERNHLKEELKNEQQLLSSEEQQLKRLAKEKEKIEQELLAVTRTKVQEKKGGSPVSRPAKVPDAAPVAGARRDAPVRRPAAIKPGIARKAGGDGVPRGPGEGDDDRALDLLGEEERNYRNLGDKDGLQRSLGNQALIHRDRGELDRAMELHKEKERICRELGNNKGIVLSLANQAGILLYEKKDPAAALPLLKEAYRIAESSGFESLVSQLKTHLEKVRKMTKDTRNKK